MLKIFSTHDFTNHYYAGKKAKTFDTLAAFVQNLQVQFVSLYFSWDILFNDFNCIVGPFCIDWVRKIRLRISLRINSPGSSLILTQVIYVTVVIPIVDWGKLNWKFGVLTKLSDRPFKCLYADSTTHSRHQQSNLSLSFPARRFNISIPWVAIGYGTEDIVTHKNKIKFRVLKTQSSR